MHHSLYFDILALGQRGTFKNHTKKSALNKESPLGLFHSEKLTLLKLLSQL